MLRRLLAHPLAKIENINDLNEAHIRKRIIEEKQFLRKIYREWYAQIASVLPHHGAILELGSGQGFLKELIPEAITSDVALLPDISLVLDAHCMPFANESLAAIVMIDVLHHLSGPRDFFAEAERCLRPGGVIAMVEPWVTSWSRFVYGRFHHEPFLPDASQWESPSDGPLSGANGALPWIIFERDLDTFRAEFPHWRIERLILDMPLSYPISGGISMRQLAPSSLYGLFRGIERLMSPWMKRLAMFAFIVLRKVRPEGQVGQTGRVAGVPLPK